MLIKFWKVKILNLKSRKFVSKKKTCEEVSLPYFSFSKIELKKNNLKTQVVFSNKHSVFIIINNFTTLAFLFSFISNVFLAVEYQNQSLRLNSSQRKPRFGSHASWQAPAARGDPRVSAFHKHRLSNQ